LEQGLPSLFFNIPCIVGTLFCTWSRTTSIGGVFVNNPVLRT
jgi:hypothetical protein